MAQTQTTRTQAPVSPVVTPQADNEVFVAVEKLPEFPGGNSKFTEFIKSKLNRGKAAHTGRIIVTFVVEKDGSLSGIKSIGSISDKGAEKEALRVVGLSPKWVPGQQNGNLVKVQYTVAVPFE
ncbi:energy transducer TonB [Mucilaginibacter terrae]|uniref:energy transducer TonB n=1 Tax=Mucilaginibacter terrae TaxID=1955052 RepID=UPI00366C2431